MSFILNNAKGNTDFEPDPFLDTGAEYEAKLIGIVETGKHQQEDYDDPSKVSEKLECLITYELVEEETRVTRGAEGSEYTVPRTYTKFDKFSSHELSSLYKQCKTANQDCVTQEGLDITAALGQPVMLVLKNNKKGDRQNIAEVKGVPVKFRSSIGEAEGKPFLYTCSVNAGAHVGTIEDVPVWMLKRAVDKSLYPEQFPNLEEIEDYIEAGGKSSKTAGEELEGDRAPVKEEKKPAKKAPAKKEKVEETVEEKAEEAPAEKSTRTRRKKAEPKAEADPYADLDEAALEDLLIEKGVSDDDLDAISEGADSDEAYLAALKAKLTSL
jgi:hypothetical protein